MTVQGVGEDRVGRLKVAPLKIGRIKNSIQNLFMQLSNTYMLIADRQSFRSIYKIKAKNRISLIPVESKMMHATPLCATAVIFYDLQYLCISVHLNIVQADTWCCLII